MNPPLPRYSLLVVATLDGFIARASGHTPANWASGEEQALFFEAVEAADWSVIGRVTHDLTPRPNRRRIVLSRSAAAPAWRAPMHLWVDPSATTPADLPALVAAQRPMRDALILGGVAVHDWFHAHRSVDRVALTVEPIRFGEGLPVFSDQKARDPAEAFAEKGYRLRDESRLNRHGTRLLTFDPPHR